ncbi:hypothetical protein, partial [Bacillus subtilis]|uniref:hypothetical protein n=1 Tax=Bacillus subtilis TaxID=1423 RepID=UPI003C1A7E62
GILSKLGTVNKAGNLINKATPVAMSLLEGAGNMGDTMQKMSKEGRSVADIDSGIVDYATKQLPLDIALGKAEYMLA